MTRTQTALALALATGTCSAQNTITVPDDVPTLSLALNPAVSGLAAGDTIVLRDTVAYAGTFTINTPDITIREAAGDDVVVDAFGTGAAFTVDAAGGSVTFEGLTIQNGANPGSNGAAINVLASGGLIARDCIFRDNTAQAGGAIYSTVSSTVLENCTFSGNSTTMFGGAIRTAGTPSQSVTITGCTFTNNHALGGNGGAIDHAGSGAALNISGTLFSMNTCTTTGGAVFCTSSDSVTLDGCDFFDNTAGGIASEDTGGAFFTSTTGILVRDCDFERNICPGSGGALRFSNSTGTLIDNRFVQNVSSSGGAFQVVGASAAADVFNCVFDANSARGEGSDDQDGGAIICNGDAFLAVYNSLFVDNTAATGGAIIVRESSDIVVYNSTFAGNDADTFGGAIRRLDPGSSTNINSSIFSGNLPTPQQVTIGNVGNTSVNYSLIDGGFANINENAVIDADPMFVDAAGGDYSLMAGSPAIDAGSSARYVGGPLSDLAGNDRGQDDPDTTDTGEVIIGAVIDMGAYEFNNNSGIPDCPADQNFDGMLSPTDFSAWIGNYNAGCD